MIQESTRSRATLALCFIAALLEGFDNQSMGVAAPRAIKEFGLSAAQSGWIFSATTIGLTLGAMIGGRVADRIGRKWTLIVSLLLFGVCSLLTAVASSTALLFIARLCTGLGLGGAMPNYITLAAESLSVERRLKMVTAIMAAMPLGGALAGLMALGAELGWGWRSIFYVGGAGPLLLAIGMIRWLPESASFKRSAALAQMHEPTTQHVWKLLFGANQATTTLVLWVSFFFTQLVLLLMLNWLPTLLINLGFTASQASWMSICFNLSGSVGSVFIGHLQAGKHRPKWVMATYAGIAITLVVVGVVEHDFIVTLLACAAAGVFIIGAQLVLFALAPLYYPAAVRGSGVGFAVAVGRLGSVMGPLFAGSLLSAGGTAATVLFGIEPFVVIAGGAALALCARQQVRD